MQTFKRTMALVLTLVMVFSIIPVGALGAEPQPAPEMDTGDVTIEGTNGFGNLLSDAITEEQEASAEAESEYEAGYTVTDLEIVDNVATVTYDSMEEAILIVALYTEDGMQMVTSAKATVTADETEATVTFGDDMPQYFLASAYLVDTYDLSPLCAAYDTPMYTQEMQELLASTVNDYDPERVLNLDEDESTNFAVYAETTKVIEPVEGVNTVASVDDETATYVIENADEQFTALAVGDVFAYGYSENDILIVKVAAITVDGTTVSITGNELEMDEVFSCVKIEGRMDVENAEIESSTIDEGITYIGKIQEDTEETENLATSGVHSNGNEISRETAIGYEYHFYDEGIFSVEGTLEIKSKVLFDYYITQSYQRIEFAVEFGGKIGLKAKLSGYPVDKEAKIGTLIFPVVPGIRIDFTPSVVLKLEVSAEGSFEFKSTIGAALTHGKEGWDLINLCSAPKVSLSFELEGKIFVGFKLTPAAKVLGGALAEAEVAGQLGFVISGKIVDVSTSDSPDEKHDCIGCLDGKLAFQLKISTSFQCLKSKKLKFTAELVNATADLFSFYLCAQHLTFGIGKCPRIVYKLTVEVLDSDGEPVTNAMVTAGAIAGRTNALGLTEVWLPLGDYTVEVLAPSGTEHGSAYLFVDGPCKISITISENGTLENCVTILDNVDDWSIIDAGEALCQGYCGENATWMLYSGGLLRITGQGAMYEYDISLSSAPSWYNYRTQITHVVVENGITSIGREAFRLCSNLVSIYIPDTVTAIGEQAFTSCGKLKNLVLGNSVVRINRYAFENCSSLVHVDLPKSVTEIGPYAFKGCKGLVSIDIPEGVKYIYASTFYNCTSLCHVNIPDTVTSIAFAAFAGCESLSSITIPDSVTRLGHNVLSNCDNLQNVTIGNHVETIDFEAFYLCSSLESITIPASVQSIGYKTFYGCTKLTSVIFEGNAPTIGGETFNQVTANIYYPADNDTWTSDIMQNYGGTITWIPYTSGVSTDVSTANLNVLSAKNISNNTLAREDYEVASVYPGEYSTEITETYTIKTASFTGLVPDQQYVLLAMKSIEVEDPLASDNLLFVDQAAAGEDGTLVFSYVQRETAEISYVVACGASNKNLSDAEITFPEMTADGELQVVDPTVVYDGVTLTEGRDYTIVGSVSFTQGGTYTCYIRGIHNYTGLVECTYTVTSDVESVATGWSGATTWVLTSDGVLTFSGEGNMKNYGWNIERPWEAYADQITSVVIEEGVTAVGSGAFKDMTALKTVTLPASGLSKIGIAAFYGCTSLEEIYIPDGVYTIWEYTFKNCTGLKSVRLPKTLVKIDQGAFEACTALTELFLPTNTEIIGGWSFKGCTAMKRADMQWADATEIRAGAFKNCSALTEIILPGNIQTLGDSCFYGIGATSFTVPETVTTVEAWCFARASLTEIIFEGDAPAIGEGAFNKITLTAYYPADNATWTAENMLNYGGNTTWKAQ